MRLRDVEVGDVLVRRIGNTGLFHYGLVTEVGPRGPVEVIDHDYDGRHHSDLAYFRWDQKRLWVAAFSAERRSGARFRSREERVAEALRLHKESSLYCPETNNCEHFVRRCVFRDPALWYSRQVARIRTNDVTVGLRLAMAAFGVAPNIAPEDAVEVIFEDFEL
jgi:hypothetical protein